MVNRDNPKQQRDDVNIVSINFNDHASKSPKSTNLSKSNNSIVTPSGYDGDKDNIMAEDISSLHRSVSNEPSSNCHIEEDKQIEIKISNVVTNNGENKNEPKKKDDIYANVTPGFV